MSSDFVAQRECFFFFLVLLRGVKLSSDLWGTDWNHPAAFVLRFLWVTKGGFLGGVQDELYFFIFMQVAGFSLEKKLNM